MEGKSKNNRVTEANKNKMAAQCGSAAMDNGDGNGKENGCSNGVGGSGANKLRPSRISLLLSHWDSIDQTCVSDGPLSVQEASDTSSPPPPPPPPPPSLTSSATSSAATATAAAPPQPQPQPPPPPPAPPQQQQQQQKHHHQAMNSQAENNSSGTGAAQGQSALRSGSSSANHVQASAAGGEVAGASNAASGTPASAKDGPRPHDTGQINGTTTSNNTNNNNNSLLNEQRSNLKNLPLQEVISKVKAIVVELEQLQDYHRGEGMRFQKMLGDFYWDYNAHRREIGDALGECGYAALTVKMLKTMNAMGIFKNDDIWFPTYYTYNTAWNYSDASDHLAKSLAEADAVRLLTLNLGHKPYLSAVQSKNVYYVLKASLSTLHNIARSPDVRHYFKENKTSEVIIPFIAQKDEFLKALSMLTLAYIVEEEENAQLIDDTGTIQQIVVWIDKATEKSNKRRFRGFAPWELTQGLDKLAVNDTNKMKVVDAGALPVFMKMLKHDDPKEQAATAHCLWTLSFDKNVRQLIKDQEGMIDVLDKLSQSEHATVKKSAVGALWILKGENDPSTSTRPKSASKLKSHIFISYSWNEKELVKQIRERLRTEGYKVWIDYEQMGGSTLQAMAEAVENSAVVLVCMSEKYKESANCRTESEYTFQLRKDYIPLMMQKKYRPDGWLGAILGAKLFFDFSGKYPMDKSMQGLNKELRGRGQASQGQDSLDEADAAITAEVASSATVVHAGNPHRVISHHVASHSTYSMSPDDVVQWLKHNQLDSCVHSMAQLNGRLLWQLKRMKEEAPQFFFQLLDTKLKLSFVDILKLSSAMDDLH